MLGPVSRFLKKLSISIKRSKPGSKEQIFLQGIEDLIYPIVIDWQLDEDDHKVIGSYVALFIRDNDILVERMVVSPDLYPSLHRFMSSLKGERSWQEFMAAFDYLEENWPEVKPLIEDSDKVANLEPK